MLEKNLYHVLIPYLKQENTYIYQEIPFFMKHIDILCVSSDRKKLTSIEVKVKDWFRGYQQAMHHKIFAENSYLAISAENSHKAIKHIEFFIYGGIGILEVDGHVRELLPARVSTEIFPSYKNLILQTIEKKHGW
jgi:hypothetical protein